MTGRGQDQGHGRPLLAEPVWPGSADTPLGGVGPVELHIIPPGLLDDLYDPDLIIDPGYIGPDRRRAPRAPRETGPPLDRSSGIVRTLLTVLVTAAAAVLLTLMAIHPAPSATAATVHGSRVPPNRASGTNSLRTAGPTQPTGATGRVAAQTRPRASASASARIACAPAVGAAKGGSCVRRREVARRRALAHLRALRRARRSERLTRRAALRHPSTPAR